MKTFRLWASRIIIILFGGFLYAFAVQSILAPHNMLSGGVTGVSMIINHYVPFLPTGIIIIIFNLPLFVLGYFYVSKRFLWLTVLGTASSSLFMIFLTPVSLPIKDSLLAMIFGGILSGLGTGLILRCQSSTGGTDIIGVIINSRRGYSIGSVATALNTFILVAAGAILGLEKALMTLLSIIIYSQVMDMVLEGFNRRKIMLVISDKWQEMAKTLVQQSGRGVTIMEAKGAYSGIDKPILYCVVRPTEVPRLRESILTVDKDAFVTVSDAREVLNGRLTGTGL